MAQTTVHIRTVQNACVAIGWAGHRTLTIDRETQAGGMGLGFNGGDLLLLAIGGCYCNDLFREAAKLGKVMKSVQVDVEADWGGDPIRAQHVTFAARIEAEASEADILALIEHTDNATYTHLLNVKRVAFPIPSRRRPVLRRLKELHVIIKRLVAPLVKEQCKARAL
jgi:putative redox protein